MLLNVATILPTQQKETPPYVWFNRLFSPPECAELIRLGESKVLEPGKIGNGMDNQTVVNQNYRCVLTAALTTNDAPWAYERLRDKTTLANADFFRYDLVGFCENLIFLRYDFDPARPGKYEWHQDIGGGMSSLRKLSTVTQLSQEKDYDGGRLRMFTNCDFDPGHVDQGDTVIFPSYTPHCVTPMERGVRHSLVSWVTGPSFR
jgi:PKHD-type hydroxylase